MIKTLLKGTSILALICLILFGSYYLFNKNHEGNNKKAEPIVSANSKQKNLSSTSIKAADNQNTVENTTVQDEDVQANNQSSTDNVENHDLDSVTLDAHIVPQIINNTYPDDGKKVICLTFDDGPSTTVTPQILDVLNKYNVKATFFLIGSNIEKNDTSKSIVAQTANDGHSLGNHTYSHTTDYNIPTSLYYKNAINIDLYFSELEHTYNIMKQIIGQDFKSRIIRMPGGHMTRVHQNSANLDKFDQKLQEDGLVSIDWNCSDLDTVPTTKTADQIVQNTISYIGNKEKVILLMHDTYGKEETAKALPRIIEYYKARGYEFERIK